MSPHFCRRLACSPSTKALDNDIPARERQHIGDSIEVGGYAANTRGIFPSAFSRRLFLLLSLDRFQVRFTDQNLVAIHDWHFSDIFPPH